MNTCLANRRIQGNLCSAPGIAAQGNIDTVDVDADTQIHVFASCRNGMSISLKMVNDSDGCSGRSGVDGYDFPATSSNQQHTLQALSQNLKKFHILMKVCQGQLKPLQA